MYHMHAEMMITTFYESFIQTKRKTKKIRLKRFLFIHNSEVQLFEFYKRDEANGQNDFPR